MSIEMYNLLNIIKANLSSRGIAFKDDFQHPSGIIKPLVIINIYRGMIIYHDCYESYYLIMIVYNSILIKMVSTLKDLLLFYAF